MENVKEQKGLTGFQIKVLALIFMTFDHIHYLFTGVLNIPVWFTMLGRLAAPIFIFMVATGMRYTHSREKYILRLYIGFVAMSILNNCIGSYFPHPNGTQLIANIFGTLFLICFFIYLSGKIKQAFIDKKYLKILIFAIVGAIPLVGGFFLFQIITIIPQNAMWIFIIVNTFFPLALLVEGGLAFIILGIGFYLCGQSKVKQTIFYLGYCAFIIFSNLSKGISLTALFTTNIQWFMVFALVFILLYNGKRGKGMKYFFYFYYPVHIYALYFLALFVDKIK